MAELKTKPSKRSVDAFIKSIPHDRTRADCAELVAMYREVTKLEPVLWGTKMVGFGTYDYTYASGHSGTVFRLGFAPRSRGVTLYLASLDHAALLAKLGKHTCGKSCLYLNSLDDIDRPTLKKLVRASFRK